MIAAVMYVYNEADIVEHTIRNLFNEGVQRVFVAHGPSTDNTGELLRGRENIHVWQESDRTKTASQQQWVNQLSHEAARSGADWVLPVDADEFWGRPSTTVVPTLATVLSRVDPEYGHVTVPLYHHSDIYHKVLPAERLPKVAYRATEHTQVGPGNHSVSNAGLGLSLTGQAEIRHYQYRSYEHFCRKVMERNKRLSAECRERGDGVHHTRLENVSEQALQNAWQQLNERSVIRDPIPYYFRAALSH